MAMLIKFLGCGLLASLAYYLVGQLAGHGAALTIGGVGLSLSVILGGVTFLFAWSTAKI